VVNALRGSQQGRSAGAFSDGTGRSPPSKAAEASPDCTEPEKQRLRLVKHDLLERLQAASTREEAQRILEEDVPEELKSEDVFVQLVAAC
jgi:hypothetical protein